MRSRVISPGAHGALVLGARGRMMSDYDVTLVDDNTADMYVIFHGPKDSVWSPAKPPPPSGLPAGA